MRWLTAITLSIALASGSARAEPPTCRLCADGTAPAAADEGKARPMAIEVRTVLDFDRVILTGPSGGTARLSPDGSRSTEGAITGLTGRAMFGEVLIKGEPNRPVRIALPRRIDLFGLAGGSLAVTRITSDAPALPRLDGEGELRVRFGGELFVTGDSEGEYRGDVPIDVEYQ